MSKTPSQSKLQKRLRLTVRLTTLVEKNLLAYTAAAGAAGLMMSQSAEAKVIYTPANIHISSPIGEKLGIDLNHDGIRDFFFLLNIYKGAILQVFPTKLQSQNAVAGSSRFASALNSGVTVGPDDNFQAGHNLMAEENCSSGFCSSEGNWKDAQDLYLGLQFIVQGKTHYGWVRLNVNAQKLSSDTLITGYAFETVPNEPIITGRTQSAEAAPDMYPAPLPVSGHWRHTLGLLALGSAGIEVWRKELEPLAVE